MQRAAQVVSQTDLGHSGGAFAGRRYDPRSLAGWARGDRGIVCKAERPAGSHHRSRHRHRCRPRTPASEWEYSPFCSWDSLPMVTGPPRAPRHRVAVASDSACAEAFSSRLLGRPGGAAVGGGEDRAEGERLRRPDGDAVLGRRARDVIERADGTGTGLALP